MKKTQIVRPGGCPFAAHVEVPSLWSAVPSFDAARVYCVKQWTLAEVVRDLSGVP